MNLPSDRSEFQRWVDEFMVKAGQELPPCPVVPSDESLALRVGLIEEELDELKQAVRDRDIVKIADGLIDILVVTLGGLSACGMSDHALMNEVMRNNMAKFGPGGYRREDGKWCKPPGHQPPDIEGILTRQGYRSQCEDRRA
jgi:predicted HAD superfamily Cof-like phosphohydrolase